MKKFKRFIPILIIIALMLLGYFTGAYKTISFETLKQHHRELQNIVDDSPILSPIMFMGVYAVTIALSIPGGLFLSLIGGYLFPQPFAGLYVIFSATLGATLLFLAARSAFGKPLRKKAAPWLSKMRKGFQENATSYLLFLRFIPFFPFWLVNLAPAFFNVRLSTFIWTTLIGIVPGSFISTQVGRGLNSIFESQEEFSFAGIFTTEVKIALVCLGILSLVPIIVKKLRARKK